MDYPSTLPAPDHTSYTGSSAFGVLRTNLPTANASQIKTFNSPALSFSLTFSMTNDQYTEWLSWAGCNGWDWFYIDLVTPLEPVYITSKHLVRFLGETQYAKRGDNWLSVTVGAELRPGAPEDPLAPGRMPSDWIVAGSPGSPSPDDIDPGTIDNPSTGGPISAELYYY